MYTFMNTESMVWMGTTHNQLDKIMITSAFLAIQEKMKEARPILEFVVHTGFSNLGLVF